MTILELSAFIKIPARTVFHWAKKASVKVSDKMAQAKAHNKAADLTMAECVEVVRAGGNHLLADFLETSANVQGQARTNAELQTSNQRNSTAAKLPSGAQITAMLKVYGPKDMAKRLDFVLGYKEPVLNIAAKPVQKTLGLEGPAASEEEIRQAFSQGGRQ